MWFERRGLGGYEGSKIGFFSYLREIKAVSNGGIEV